MYPGVHRVAFLEQRKRAHVAGAYDRAHDDIVRIGRRVATQIWLRLYDLAQRLQPDPVFRQPVLAAGLDFGRRPAETFRPAFAEIRVVLRCDTILNVGEDQGHHEGMDTRFRPALYESRILAARRTAEQGWRIWVSLLEISRDRPAIADPDTIIFDHRNRRIRPVTDIRNRGKGCRDSLRRDALMCQGQPGLPSVRAEPAVVPTDEIV